MTNRARQPPYAWVISAYDRDWEALGLVEQLLAAGVRLGLIGTLDRLGLGDQDRPQPLPPHTPAEVPGLLGAALWGQPGPKQLTAAGTTPVDWQLALSWFRDSPPGAEKLEAIGSLTLRFDRGTWDDAASTALWAEFCALHGAANTTHASIESWDLALDLRDRAPPLISQATMDSVYWANYLDPECMTHFERDRLDLSGAAEARWGTDGDLHLRLSATLGAGPTPAERARVEALRRRLLDAFRAARAA
jgi:hypothetical protein